METGDSCERCWCCICCCKRYMFVVLIISCCWTIRISWGLGVVKIEHFTLGNGAGGVGVAVSWKTVYRSDKRITTILVSGLNPYLVRLHHKMQWEASYRVHLTQRGIVMLGALGDQMMPHFVALHWRRIWPLGSTLLVCIQAGQKWVNVATGMWNALSWWTLDWHSDACRQRGFCHNVMGTRGNRHAR